MTSQKYDYLFKIVVIGASDVGKTNLVKRFTKGEFEPSRKPTVIEFYEKIVSMQEKLVKAQIWDIGGQQSSIRHFYRGAWGFVIVYSVDNKESFEKAKSYLDDVKKATMQEKGTSSLPVAIMLVGNKSDLADQRAVAYDEARAYAESQNVLFTETSAQDSSDDAHNTFEKLLQVIFKTSSFEKAYGNTDLRSSAEYIPATPDVRKREGAGLLGSPETRPNIDSQPGSPMRRVNSGPHLLQPLDESPATTSTGAITIEFQDPQAERLYGNLFQGVFAVMGNMIYGATCSSLFETEQFVSSVILFIPRLFMYMLLFLLHFVLLLFVILPFSFWYFALRGANKIFRFRGLDPKSVHAQRFQFFAKIIPMLFFLVLIPIFYINTFIPAFHSPHDASTVSSVTLGIHLATMLLMLIIATIRRFQVAPEPSSEPQSKSGFNYTNPQNWIIFLALLFEGLSLLAWPLQQPAQARSDFYENRLDDMTHRAFPAFFLTLSYDQFNASYGTAISMVFAVVALITIQVMIDIKKYTKMMSEGKVEAAAEFYTYSISGSVMYGHGQLKYANRVICALFVIVCDAMFLQVTNQLLSTVACSTDSIWLNNPDMQCWTGNHKGIATISVMLFLYYVFICVLYSPLFIQVGFGENDIKFTKLYLRIVTICKTFMVIYSTFWALRAASSVVASSMVTSGVLLMVTFSWTITDKERQLHTPCTLPFINMLKCSIYLTSFWAGATAAAISLTTDDQRTKFSLVLAGVLVDFVVLMVCYLGYKFSQRNRPNVSQVEFQQNSLEMGTR